jgi:hypothetical protein
MWSFTVNLFFSPALRSRLALAATALVAAGCSINYTDGLLVEPTNSCASDDECANGAS